MPFQHPYLPQTPEDQAEMLKTIGVKDVAELFSPIPKDLQLKKPLDLPAHLTEMELKAEFQRLSGKNLSTGKLDNYLGAGVYEHYSPSSIRHLLNRSEWDLSDLPGHLKGLVNFLILLAGDVVFDATDRLADDVKRLNVVSTNA
jgi:glycine cleavage system pyridoxal-binding protein P